MCRIEVVAIGPHTASFDGSTHSICSVPVACPHARAQTVQGVIGNLERFGITLEGGQREHRSEDLLLEHAHLVVSLQDSRLIVIATCEFSGEGIAPAADQKLGTFIKANIDIALDLLDLGTRHLCTDLCIELEWAALLDCRDPR